MDSEHLRYLSVIGETVDEFDPEEAIEDEKTFSASGDLVIEQLHPFEEGISKVAEVVLDSEEEDEPTEPLRAPVSSFVCGRNVSEHVMMCSREEGAGVERKNLSGNDGGCGGGEGSTAVAVNLGGNNSGVDSAAAW
ncbi:unnamed protein product [Cuscuta campestris]|uniref:Uncharacterized protein n=1 Tax=Cuscuta campestris TaxID=132261 RepID=A0A484M0I4_9ASTE|nr:unnamed protein product [Cuscuta campestris]